MRNANMTQYKIVEEVTKNNNNLFTGNQNDKIVEKNSFSSNMESIKVKKIRFELNDTFTPPPKEFKRSSDRKTLRAARCNSTIITDKDRIHLNTEERPSQGFVKSMCKYFGSNGKLNRSASFSNVNEEPTISEFKDLSEEEIKKERGGSFRLFRGRSWNRRRKKSERVSPSSSLKSQDSGFSDSERGVVKEIANSSEEDEEDLNMTQCPIKNQIQNSLGNIASLQEGLRLKAQFSEENEISLMPRPPPGLNIRLLNICDNSQLAAVDDNTPVFSTPVRASFRSKNINRLSSKDLSWSHHSHDDENQNEPSLHYGALPESAEEHSLVAVWSQFLTLHETSSSSSSSFSSSKSTTLGELNGNPSIIEHEEEKYRISLSSSSHKGSKSPVTEWRNDLGLWCEPECMTYLQSKPIRKTSSGDVVINSDYVSVMIETLSKFQNTARSVKVTLDSLHNHINDKNHTQISKTVSCLNSQIQEFVIDKDTCFENKENYCFKGDWNFPGLRISIHPNEESDKDERQGLNNNTVYLQQRVVLQMMDKLKFCTHRLQYATSSEPLFEMKKIVLCCEKAFAKFVDDLLLHEIKKLIHELNHPSSEIGLRSVLNTLIQLGNQGSSLICRLISEEKGVSSLLNLSHSSHSSTDIKILSLRSLSSICCVVECVRELENNNGIAILNDLLCNRHSSIEERIETAGVLAQITSPWIENNIKLKGLDEYVPDLVASLTGLSRLSDGDETFLLVTAALANLTFNSPLASASMVNWRTAQNLVKAVRASPSTTVFAKDQVVTVLANMAANANCRNAVMNNNGMNFLLTMLDTSLTELDYTAAEMAAAERVIKKAAIALSRLCNDASSCEELLSLGGVDRLVQLCKDPGERNYCDGIYLACLNALKRLKKNSVDGEVVIHQLKGSLLLEPSNLDMEPFPDSLFRKQESYV